MLKSQILICFLHRNSMKPSVLTVQLSGIHTVLTRSSDVIKLNEGKGIEGDAHCGSTVNNHPDVRGESNQPNLRQVHLTHSELLNELKIEGFTIDPGDMGENVTTIGVDLLGLPTGAKLLLGNEAVVQITGLRNPCVQLESVAHGVMDAVLGRNCDGEFVSRAGVMGIVVAGGEVHPGDEIAVELPVGKCERLQTV